MDAQGGAGPAPDSTVPSSRAATTDPGAASPGAAPAYSPSPPYGTPPPYGPAPAYGPPAYAPSQWGAPPALPREWSPPGQWSAPQPSQWTAQQPQWPPQPAAPTGAQWGTPSPEFGGPQPQYGGLPPQYGAPLPQYGAPTPPPYGAPAPPQYGGPPPSPGPQFSTYPPDYPPYPPTYPAYPMYPAAAAGPIPGLVWGGYGVRFGAYLLDVGVALIGLIVAAVAAYLLSDRITLLGTEYTLSTPASDTVWWIYGLSLLAYFPVLWTWKGASLGQMALGLRVVRGVDGGPIDLGTAILRTIGKAIATFVACVFFFLGALLVMGTVWNEPRKRMWQDQMAGTVVVKRA